jgi:hypothetical protein
VLKQLPLLFVDRAVIDDGARFVCAPNHRTLKNGPPSAGGLELGAMF